MHKNTNGLFLNYSSSKPFLFIIFSLAIFCYLFSDICFPFAVGFVLAYLFAPLVDYCSKRTNRSFVCLILSLLSIFIFITAAAELLPTIREYVSCIATNLPQYYDDVMASFDRLLTLKSVSPYKAEIETAKTELQQYFNQKVYILATIMQEIVARKGSIAGFFSFFIIMPISLFYFSRDWNKVSSKIFDFIPLRYHNSLHDIFSVIRRSCYKFLRAQFYVSVSLSSYYMLALHTLGVDHNILLGIISGFASFIPFIGALLSCALVIFVTVMKLSLMQFYGIVIIYMVGQCVEGYILTPKLIRKGTGLHPLWILFSFFAGFQMFGIIGVLISIPILAIIQGLVNFYLKRLKADPEYKL